MTPMTTNPTPPGLQPLVPVLVRLLQRLALVADVAGRRVTGLTRPPDVWPVNRLPLPAKIYQQSGDDNNQMISLAM